MMLKPKFKPVVDDPTPEEMRTIADGARMAHMLPYIKESIERQLDVIQTRVYAAIANGSFTPEMAVTAWHEMAANRNMLKRYSTKVTLGINAAERHSETFKLGDE